MKAETKEIVLFAIETFLVTMFASAVLCYERWWLDMHWRHAKEVSIESIFEFSTGAIFIMTGAFCWYIYNKFFLKRQKVTHLDSFKPEVLEHLHLLSIVLKIFIHSNWNRQVAQGGWKAVM